MQIDVLNMMSELTKTDICKFFVKEDFLVLTAKSPSPFSHLSNFQNCKIFSHCGSVFISSLWHIALPFTAI
jgi:uracil DNA glycosylase